MPTAEKTQKKTRKSVMSASQIKKSFKKYLLTEGKEPNSVFHFTESLGIEEEEFYNHFSSFKSVQETIWSDFIKESIAILEKDRIYQEYSNREKLLAFYFTFIERLLKDRSFVESAFKVRFDKTMISPPYLKKFKEAFLDFIRDLIQHGITDEEIVKRPVLSDRYKDGLWLQLLFVINFWLKDDSPNFEKTDAAIEKSVNLSFELMGNGPLDQLFDFAKFLFQNKTT